MDVGQSRSCRCLLFARCGILRSSMSGAATFFRSSVSSVSGRWPRWPRWPERPADESLVTITTNERLALKLSVEESEIVLKEIAEGSATAAWGASDKKDLFSIKYVKRLELQSLDVLVVRVEISHGGKVLCAKHPQTESFEACDKQHVGLSLLSDVERKHRSADFCEWQILRANENQDRVKSKPCVWLRLSLSDLSDFSESQNFTEGQYLAVDSGTKLRFLPWSDLENSASSSSCWTFGYEQTWTRHHVAEREDFPIPSKHERKHALHLSHDAPHVWLMASPKYDFALRRLLRSFEGAGEGLHVFVQWVPDLKDTERQGFKLTGVEQSSNNKGYSRKVFAFNYLKLLFLFQAFLDSLFSDVMVIVMDLDVQVQLGCV